MQMAGGPAQPSPTIEEAVGSGFFFLIVKCKRCNHQGPDDLRLLRRAPRTDIWRLEDSLRCEECNGAYRWKACVHMVKLAKTTDSEPWYPPEER
jgi:hypothetical protein